MDERTDATPLPPRPPEEELLPFRPWMLAAAVLLACALGVAVMERSSSDLWASRGSAASARP